MLPWGYADEWGGGGKLTLDLRKEGTRAYILGSTKTSPPEHGATVVEHAHRQARQQGELPEKYPYFLKVISIGGIGGLAHHRNLHRQFKLDVPEMVCRDVLPRRL